MPARKTYKLVKMKPVIINTAARGKAKLYLLESSLGRSLIAFLKEYQPPPKISFARKRLFASVKTQAKTGATITRTVKKLSAIANKPRAKLLNMVSVSTVFFALE